MEKNELKLVAHHTAISVSDLDKSVDWYQKMLGFEPMQKFERPDLGAKIAMMRLANYNLELFCFEDYKPLPEYRKKLSDDLHTLGTKHLAFGVEDIDHAFNILKNKGIKFETEPSLGASGHRYTFFKDLDGILIELFENKPYRGESK